MDMEKQIAELQTQVNYLLQTLAVQDQELAVPKAVAQVPMDGEVLSSDNPFSEEDIDFHWKVTKVSSAGESITVSIHQNSAWLQNPHLNNTKLTLGVTYFPTYSFNKNYYLSAYVYRNTGAKHPALYPDRVELIATASEPTLDSIEAILESEEYNMHIGGFVLLGKATSGEWEQYWFGGDITYYHEVPDGNTNVLESGERRTIERNPSTAGRESELQLVNSVEAVKPKNFALLSVRDPEEEPPVMEMEWPAVDSSAGAGLSTLDVANVGTTKLACLKNADLIGVTGKLIGYIDSNGEGGAVKELKWANPDTHKPSATSSSIELSSDQFQIANWEVAEPGAYSAVTHSGVLARIASGKEAQLVDPTTLPVPTHNHDGTYSPTDHEHAHTELSDMPDTGEVGTNTDHDARYWVRGAEYAQNTGLSIGRYEGGGGGSTEAINLTESKLVGGWQVTGALTVATDISATNGNIEVVASGKVFKHESHAGKSHPTKIVLTDINGTAVECYLRGGILCVD